VTEEITAYDGQPVRMIIAVEATFRTGIPLSQQKAVEEIAVGLRSASWGMTGALGMRGAISVEPVMIVSGEQPASDAAIEVHNWLTAEPLRWEDVEHVHSTPGEEQGFSHGHRCGRQAHVHARWPDHLVHHAAAPKTYEHDHTDVDGKGYTHSHEYMGPHSHDDTEGARALAEEMQVPEDRHVVVDMGEGHVAEGDITVRSEEDTDSPDS
jgi:hypothetical protein